MSKEPTQDKEQKTADDDRNLVVSDSDFKEAEFDERVWLFWRRNKGMMVFLTLLVAAVALSFPVARFLQKHKIEKNGHSYLELRGDNPTKFLLDHSDSPLAGMLLIEQADEAYLNKSFEEAADQYSKAVDALGETPIADRARIGAAVCLIRLEKLPEAQELLRAVAGSDKVFETLRAEANFHLAVLALEQGDIEGARTHLETISEMPFADLWLRKAQNLHMMTPELQEAPADS